uniref:Pleckstrin homology domain-containing family A member 8 n=1 Tax=Romanomermis culicivorax TaxID=13658 RepID=A0A915L6E9_ROMCU
MQSSKIEGTLFKWTNYWNGWMPRWFVLDKNILSYYASQEEVSLGCKGSINIAAAMIIAHQTDSCRLDVVIPGEQHFYLKAVSPHERQNWLVALGSAKSCVNSEKAFKAIDNVDKLTRKQGEVRLYCDLLMQQIHSIKCLVMEHRVPDLQKLDECSSLVGHTCDAFIGAIDDCAKLSLPNSPLDITGLSLNCTSDNQNSNGHLSPNSAACKFLSRNKPDKDEELRTTDSGGTTFFSKLKHNFSSLKLRVDRGSEIDTCEFLNCCEDLLALFDFLNENAFVPIKMDFQSNIKKLIEKHKNLASLPVERNGGAETVDITTLQGLLYDEIAAKSYNEPHSAVATLLWLIRGMQFIGEFLRQFSISLELKENERKTLTDMINDAYDKTLKNHHGRVLRNVFTVAF